MNKMKLKICLSLLCMIFVIVGVIFMIPTNRNNVYADDGVFEMEDGVSLKLNDDGGMRFRVKMDEATKNLIVEDGTTDNVKLYFIVTSKNNFSKIDGKNYFEALSVNNYANIIHVDESKIYFDKDKNSDVGYYWANGCLVNVQENHRDWDCVCIAAIETDNAGVKTYKYARVDGKKVTDNDFSINNVRGNLYKVLNMATLDVEEKYTSSILESPAYTWFGTNDYPLQINDIEDYENLVTKINQGNAFSNLAITMDESVDTSKSTVEVEQGKVLPQNIEVLHTVLFYDDAGVLLKTIKVQDGETAVFGTAPTKAETEAYTYEFDKWVTSLGGDTEMPLENVVSSFSVYASFEQITKKFNITWKNYDGTELAVTEVSYGIVPEYEGTVADYVDGLDVYTFVGFTPSIVEATANATYTATFSAKEHYTAAMIEETSLYSQNLTDEVITKTTDENELPEGATYGYKITGNFTSIYTKLNHYVNGNFVAGNTYKFTVRYKALDLGSLSHVHFVFDESYDSNFCNINASKVVSKNITFTENTTKLLFTSWIRESQNEGSGKSASGDEISLVFSIDFKLINTYTVTWKNYDGTVLKTDYNVEEGTVPTYDGDPPVKEKVGTQEYEFAGWDKEIVALTGDTVYTATFKEAATKYTITWKNYDDTEIYSEQIKENTLPVFDTTQEIKIKAPEGLDVFEFTGWDSEIVSVTGDKTYTAQMAKKKRLETYRTVEVYPSVNYYNSDNMTITYTEDSSKLANGFSDGYLVNIEGATNPNIMVTNIINGNFEAGKTYRLTVMVKVIQNNWYFRLDFGWNSTANRTYALSYGQTGEFDKVETFTPEQTTDKLYYSMMVEEFAKEKNLVYSISVKVEEVTYSTLTWKDESGTVIYSEQVENGTAPVFNESQYTLPTKDDETKVYKLKWLPLTTVVNGDTVLTASFEELPPYQIVDAKEAGKLEGIDLHFDSATVTYTEDTTKLPEGATSGYVVDVSSFVSGYFAFANVINSKFTAGKIYKITVKVKQTKLNNWADYFDGFGGIGMNISAVSTGRMNPWEGNTGRFLELTTTGYNYYFTPETSTEQLVYIFGMHNEGTGGWAFTFGISIEVKEVHYYTVTWKDTDGTVLETNTKAEGGLIPTFNGTEPEYKGTIDNNNIYKYVFGGWTETVVPVTENTEYTAKYVPVYKHEITTMEDTNLNMLNGEKLSFERTTDSSKLPSGANEAVIVSADVYNNTSLYVLNVLNGDFKAGETYKITVRVKWLTAYDTLNGTIGNIYFDGIKNITTNCQTTNGHSITVTIDKDTNQLTFDSWLRASKNYKSDQTFNLPWALAYNVVYEKAYDYSIKSETGWQHDSNELIYATEDPDLLPLGADYAYVYSATHTNASMLFHHELKGNFEAEKTYKITVRLKVLEPFDGSLYFDGTNHTINKGAKDATGVDGFTFDYTPAANATVATWTSTVNINDWKANNETLLFAFNVSYVEATD